MFAPVNEAPQSFGRILIVEDEGIIAATSRPVWKGRAFRGGYLWVFRRGARPDNRP